MKTAVIFFLMGALVGGVSLYLWRPHGERLPAATTSEAQPNVAAGDPETGAEPGSSSETTSFAQRARNAAAEARYNLHRKLEDWNLTSEDISRDLAEGRRIVRSRARQAGDRISDARIVAVVNAKYVLDPDLSALRINVDCRDGNVTLSGTVSDPELIGRAIMIALESDGVHDVVSSLTTTVSGSPG